MKDVSPASTTIDRTYGTFTDDDLRSPRTPTYVPTSPNSSRVTAFDPSHIFSSPEATIHEVITSDLLPLAPVKPLAWIWQCHLCKSQYPLGVTRRCLQDGHFYCSGETDRLNLKKKKRGQSCSSEFDYIGWKEWGEWKRNPLRNLENGVEGEPCAKGCQKCEFPSQCRYTSSRKIQESTAVHEITDKVPSVSPMEEDSNLSSSAIEVKKSRFYLSKGVTFDSILASATSEQNELLELKVADFLNNAERVSHTSTHKNLSAKSNSATLNRFAKSAEESSSTKSTLSPIVEEFFFKADLTKNSFGSIALQSLNDIMGTGTSNADEDRMDLT